MCLHSKFFLSQINAIPSRFAQLYLPSWPLAVSCTCLIHLLPFFCVENILGAYDLAAVPRILDLLSHTHPEWWSVAKSWHGLQLMGYLYRYIFYRTRWDVILGFFRTPTVFTSETLWKADAWFPWNAPLAHRPLTLRSKGLIQKVNRTATGYQSSVSWISQKLKRWCIRINLGSCQSVVIKVPQLPRSSNALFQRILLPLLQEIAHRIVGVLAPRWLIFDCQEHWPRDCTQGYPKASGSRNLQLV